MALQCYVDAFNIGLGAAASTVVRTGYGFQPKACLYWWSGRTESAATFARKNIQFGFGMATSATNRACVTTSAQDTANSMITSRRYSNAACIECLTTSDTLEGGADVQSFDSDGQTLVIDDQFVTNLRVHCLALGGSDLTDATVVQFQAPSTTGAQTQDITTVGFQPTALVCLGPMGATAPPAILVHGLAALGVTVGATQNRVAGFWDQDALGTSSTDRYGFSGESVVAMGGGRTLNSRARLDSFLANGFRLNWLEVTAALSWYCYALALRGGQYAVGDLTTSTTLNATIVESGLGFQPTGVLLLSHAAAASAQDVADAQATLSIGAFTGTANRATQCIVSNDAAGTAVCASSVREDACLTLVNNGTTNAGVVDVQSIDSDGFTAIMDVADVTTTKYVSYLAFGSTPVAATKAPPPSRPALRFYRGAR